MYNVQRSTYNVEYKGDKTLSLPVSTNKNIEEAGNFSIVVGFVYGVFFTEYKVRGGNRLEVLG